jgi:hypothetical protein
MTPTSRKPLDKVTYAAVAAAVSAVVLALIRHYLWPDFPADLQGPFDTLITALTIGFITGAVGWLTPIKKGEIKPVDRAIIEHDAETKPNEVVKL